MTPAISFPAIPLFNLLFEDVKQAHDDLVADDNSQPRRRAFVRTVFSFIEGETTIRKERARVLGGRFGVTFTPSELSLLIEEQYRVGSDGNAETNRRIMRFAQNVLFSFRISEKATGDASLIDTGKKEWKDFRDALNIRNRITHPRTPADLTVSDKDILSVAGALAWYKTVSLASLDHYSKAIDSHIDNEKDNKS